VYSVYESRNTGALVNYFHKACFSPTKSALPKAVKQGHFATWSGLNEDAINNKHLKMTPVMVMGHTNQRRKIICSTSKESKSDMEDEVVFPESTGLKVKKCMPWSLTKVKSRPT
jgi:hypothetical protein